jgi:hypothetical protein
MGAIPEICADIQGKPARNLALEIKTETVSLHHNTEYDNIINRAFGARLPLLKNSYANRNAGAFYELGKFAAPSIAMFLNKNPNYAKFCEMFNYLRTKMPKPQIIDKEIAK